MNKRLQLRQRQLVRGELGDLENSRKREGRARGSLAATSRSSLSGESRAASRTPGGGRKEPESPWPQQLRAARQGRAGQPPELQEGGGQSQRLPGRNSSEQLVRGEQGSLQNSRRREDRARDSLAAAVRVQLVRGAGQPLELSGDEERARDSLTQHTTTLGFFPASRGT